MFSQALPDVGRLAGIDASVGQTVTVGQVLAREDTTGLHTALDQAQATLGQQEAKLAKVTAGATPEALAAAHAALTTPQATASQTARPSHWAI